MNKKNNTPEPESGWFFFIFGFLAIMITLVVAVEGNFHCTIIFIVGVGGGFILIGIGAILRALRRIFKLLKTISDKLSNQKKS